MRKALALALLIIPVTTSLFVWGCRKTDNNSNTPTPPVPEFITTTLTGLITTSNNSPVSGAVITTSFGSTGATDLNGKFTITNARVKSAGAVIKIEKDGYFTSVKTIAVQQDQGGYVEAQLILKGISIQFQASAGGKIAVANGGAVTFPANAIKDANTNAPYSGSINVSSYFLNPTSNDFASVMPGDLTGIDKSGQQQTLISYGMMAVELTGDKNQKLQLASGATATITFPIAQLMQAQAPATIPLWYFNDSLGLWKEEGIATKQGNNYIGTVSHFSFWNCDMPVPGINFKAIIKDKNNNPIPHIQVIISADSTAGAYYGYDYTNDAGFVSGKIPANKKLNLVLYNSCGGLIYSQVLNTGSSDIDLGTLSANTSFLPVTFSGTARDCAGNVVDPTPYTSNAVSITIDGATTNFYFTGGTFNGTVYRCGTGNTTALVKMTDPASGMQDSLSVPVNNTNVTGINLRLCKLATQTAIITVDSKIYSSYNSTKDSIFVQRNNKGFTLTLSHKPLTSIDPITISFFDPNYPLTPLSPTDFILGDYYIKPTDQYYVVGPPIGNRPGSMMLSIGDGYMFNRKDSLTNPTKKYYVHFNSWVRTPN